ncbi:TPA: hypothetical protein NJ055_004934 [Vibrio parahaemolyticus]|uniref:hypothetical protein n=1 Tax=Vibrio alginolyticus TaxID=663 RepID=UPI0037543E4B|nr:hypothetical protein [Vibrio parahaemolyticus]HCG5940760.1 hypothetical protein [Vibrio parahaemolyticus]
MTLSMAWVRDVGDHQELIFSSDSRLRFGCAWDSCQKVFPLPRGDCAITFAGDTQFAYPFIHAAINSVSLHRGSKERQIDITEVKPFLLKAINGMLADISDFSFGQDSFEEPVLRIIFGGYSWKKKDFIIWKFYFNPGEREFRHSDVKTWRGLGTNRKMIILGDPEASLSAKRQALRRKDSLPKDDEDVEKMAKERLIKLFEDRGTKDGNGLDMEPFEVLRDMIREGASPYVGGAPQLVKVYQHLNSKPFAVRWDKVNGNGISVLGRGLRHGEAMHLPLFDPDTLKFS